MFTLKLFHMCGSRVLSQVPIEWRVINKNIHGLLYVPGDPLWIPVKYGQAFRAYLVSYRGWDPKVFLEPVPKGSAWFPYVFLQTVDVWAFKSIFNPTFCSLLSLSLGGHKKGFDGVSPFEIHLAPKLLHVLLNFSPSLWMYGTTVEFFLFDPLLLLLGWLPVAIL